MTSSLYNVLAGNSIKAAQAAINGTDTLVPNIILYRLLQHFWISRCERWYLLHVIISDMSSIKSCLYETDPVLTAMQTRSEQLNKNYFAWWIVYVWQCFAILYVYKNRSSYKNHHYVSAKIRDIKVTLLIFETKFSTKQQNTHVITHCAVFLVGEFNCYLQCAGVPWKMLLLWWEIHPLYINLLNLQ